MHLMFYKYQDEIDEFYDKACELHDAELGVNITVDFHQPVGNVLAAETSAGDTFKIAEGETFPNISFNRKRKLTVLKIEAQTIFREVHYLDVTSDEEGYYALGGQFFSLDSLEDYIHHMMDEEPEAFHMTTDFDSVDVEEINSIRGITRL